MISACWAAIVASAVGVSLVGVSRVREFEAWEALLTSRRGAIVLVFDVIGSFLLLQFRCFGLVLQVVVRGSCGVIGVHSSSGLCDRFFQGQFDAPGFWFLRIASGLGSDSGSGLWWMYLSSFLGRRV